MVDLPPTPSPQKAVLAGGCFWCTEVVFQNTPGVTAVVSGYAGGDAATANYEDVCSGRTDHAECVEVTFDPDKITYGGILRIFFAAAHDPTQWNQQGPDHGRQYRSAIFARNQDQFEVAEGYIRRLNLEHVFDKPIVTEVVMLDTFYPAESYHQNYANRHPLKPYILFNATPKVRKLSRFI